MKVLASFAVFEESRVLVVLKFPRLADTNELHSRIAADQWLSTRRRASVTRSLVPSGCIFRKVR
jgi:hypothetical protein